MTWPAQLSGKFLVFDGPDGSGKSTQLKRFVAYCAERGTKVCEVREPGGTSIGEQIRKVLLDPANTDMSLRCEMMLYMASRAQLVEQIIRPALDRHELVLADRFVSSTLAYQGAASGLPLHEINNVAEVAIGKQWPNLTVIFDVDENTAARRMAGNQREKRSASPAAPQPSLFADRLELRGTEYQRRVRQGFLQQAKDKPDLYLVVDASKEPDVVFENLVKAIQARLE